MEHDQLIEILKRIEQNQEKALQAQEKALHAQEKHLELATAQPERSNQSIVESVDLQRVAVARQAQVRNIALPLILLLVALLVYLLIKWRMF